MICLFQFLVADVLLRCGLNLPLPYEARDCGKSIFTQFVINLLFFLSKFNQIRVLIFEMDCVIV
jgi:hypothetical protein